MRGLLFDLDDTLYARRDFLDSGFAAVAAYAARTRRLDRDGVLHVLREAHAGGWAGREFQVLCGAQGLPLKVLPTLVEVFRSHAPVLRLHPEVARVLLTLRRAGWRIGILTNGHPAVQGRKVRALGLAGLVDTVTYAEDHTPGGKPDPAAFLAALRSLDLPPARCVHVGDDPVRDIAGARGIGMRTIRVANPPAVHASSPAARCAAAEEADAVAETVLAVGAIATSFLPEASRVA